MSEFLARFSNGEFIGLCGVVGGLTLAAIAVLASQWRRVRVAELEAGLKQQMLERGMSAAEIEQVMHAGHAGDGSAPVASTGNEALDKAALAQRMVDNGYEGEDIERVLKAYHSSKGDVEKALAQQD